MTCKKGWFHDWYYGAFSTPVYGRYERHCLKCDRQEKRVLGKWTVFDRKQEDSEFRARLEMKRQDGLIA